MKLCKEKPEEELLYADTVLLEILDLEDGVDVIAKSYNELNLNIRFKRGTLIKNNGEYPERVEDGQIIKLKNGRRRLILFDDEKTIIFELEFTETQRICKSVLGGP